MGDNCSSLSTSLSCSSSALHLRLMAFCVSLAGGEVIVAGEGTSGGVYILGTVLLGKVLHEQAQLRASGCGGRGMFAHGVSGVAHQLVRWRPKVAHTGGRRLKSHDCQPGG
jgi:hypothetical protein